MDRLRALILDRLPALMDRRPALLERYWSPVGPVFASGQFEAAVVPGGKEPLPSPPRPYKLELFGE